MNVFQYLASLDTLDAACDAGLISNANLSQCVACLSAAYEEQEAPAKTHPTNSLERIAATPAAAVTTKEAAQRQTIDSVERGDSGALEGMTTFALHDLEFAADIWCAPVAHAAILVELDRRA